MNADDPGVDVGKGNSDGAVGVRKTYGVSHKVITRDKGKWKELLPEENESEKKSFGSVKTTLRLTSKLIRLPGSL